MSIGNLKTEGSKGTNFPWQYKMLKGLQGIIDVLNSTKDGTEYEAKLVNITCAGVPFTGTKLYLEVRVWDTVNGGWKGDPTYYLPGDTTEVPLATFTAAGCTIEYIEDNTSSLNDTSAMPTMLRVSASGLTPIAPKVKSISFYNAAAGDANVLGIALKQGETVNFDAGGNMNAFAASTFDYDADISGGNVGDLVIIYVSIV